MDATYERILSTINAKPRAQRELARRILIWTAHARMRLSIDDLALAISIETDMKSLKDLGLSIPTEESILDACANLVSVEQSKDRCVQFVHFSVQEFLTSHRSTTLSMGCELGHREIAQASMVFLTLFPKQCDFLGRYISYKRLYEYAFHQWPHHLLAGNLNSLLVPVDDQIVTLTLSFFGKGPVLFTEQPTLYKGSWSLKKDKTYLKFSPPVLALMFDLPVTPKCWPPCEEHAQPKAAYDYNDRIVVSDDKLAIHYATAELDSVPAVQRLYSHGYELNYSYSDSGLGTSETTDWRQVSALNSVQSTQMARYLLDNGISIDPQSLGNTFIVDPLIYLAQKGDRGVEVFQLLLDKAVDQSDERLKDALRTAIQVSCFEVVRILLDRGVNTNQVSTVLQDAVCHGSIEIIRLLLAKGANVNAQGGKYGNALQAAVNRGKVQVIRLLLDEGADANAQGGEFGNPLQTAAWRCKVRVVELLLDKGADVNVQGGRYDSALQAAAYKGKVEVIQLLLGKGADINVQGGKALHAASLMGKIEVIRLLLDRGVDVNAQGGRFGNALQAAARIGKLKVTQLLLDRGADVNAQGGEYSNPLQAAVSCGEIEVIRLLLDKGADVNTQSGEYGNALQAAVYGSKVEVIRLLLDKGANVNAQGGKYGNALQAAICSGNAEITRLEITRLLVDRGADVNTQDGRYGNALQTAILRGRSTKFIKLLMDKGASVNTQGGIYGNALQAAAYQGKIGVLQLLLDKGVDVNAQGGMYGNALQAAAYKGRVEVLQLLLEKGADVNTQGGMFGTTLQAAVYNGNTEVIQLLLDQGGDIYARGGKYGAALKEMLALDGPEDAGQKVPADTSLLVELLQDHAPILIKDLPESEYEGIAKEFLNEDRCSLYAFRELLGPGMRLRMGIRTGLPADVIEDGNSQGLRQDLCEAPNESTLPATVHIWKLFEFTFLVFVLYYIFFEFFGGV